MLKQNLNQMWEFLFRQPQKYRSTPLELLLNHQYIWHDWLGYLRNYDQYPIGHATEYRVIKNRIYGTLYLKKHCSIFVALRVCFPSFKRPCFERQEARVDTSARVQSEWDPKPQQHKWSGSAERLAVVEEADEALKDDWTFVKCAAIMATRYLRWWHVIIMPAR